MTASNKQTYHHGNLRQALIDEALSCIREQGSEKLSLRALARGLGVSQSAPYRHFSDKNALLTAIINQGFEKLTAHLSSETEQLMESPDLALAAAGRAYIQFAMDNPETYRLMFGMRKQDMSCEEMDEEGESLGCFQVLQNIIAQGQQAGVFKDKPLELLSLSSWSMVHGFSLLVIDQVIERTPIGQAPASNNLSEMLLKGILA